MAARARARARGIERRARGGGGPIVLPLFVLNLHALLGFSVAVSLSAVDTTGFCLSPQG